MAFFGRSLTMDGDMSTSSKRTNIILRIIGAVTAIGGGILLWYGGKTITFDLFGGAVFSIPLEYFFIVIGLMY